MTAVPVIEIGGTHVTAALVQNDVVLERHRAPLDAHSSAQALVSEVVGAANRLSGERTDASWGVAIPGPFDYDHGIGDFVGVEKFGSLRGFDLGTTLRRSLPGPPAHLTFLNDAEAYALGEWTMNERPSRLMCITLGTGVGSGFVVDGRGVSTGPTVPVDGNIHTESWHGAPLEETFSRDAIRRAYERRTGRDDDVAKIAADASKGDEDALWVLTEASIALGSVLARWVDRFLPDLVIVGGSMSRSWRVLQPGLQYGLGFSDHQPRLTHARATDDAPLLGAALHLRTAEVLAQNG